MKELCENCGKSYEDGDWLSENPEWGGEKPKDKKQKLCDDCLEDLNSLSI